MQQWLHYRMRITLQDNREMIGQFLAFDKYLNLLLTDTEEFRRVSSKGKSKKEEKIIKRPLGLVIIRGEVIVSVAVEGPPPPEESRSRFTPTGVAAGPGIGRAGSRPLAIPPTTVGRATNLAGPPKGLGGPQPGMMMPRGPPQFQGPPFFRGPAGVGRGQSSGGPPGGQGGPQGGPGGQGGPPGGQGGPPGGQGGPPGGQGGPPGGQGGPPGGPPGLRGPAFRGALPSGFRAPPGIRGPAPGPTPPASGAPPPPGAGAPLQGYRGRLRASFRRVVHLPVLHPGYCLLPVEEVEVSNNRKTIITVKKKSGSQIGGYINFLLFTIVFN